MAAEITSPIWLNRAPKLAQAAEKATPWGFAEFFVISQTAFPALLFLPGAQVIRLPLRVASYAISLTALFWWGRQLKKVAPHPSAHWLFLAAAWLVLMIFHPTTNTALAGAAQTMLYVAVLAPVFWAPGLVESPQQLKRLLLLLLICNGINSLVGVLQVYDPATWMPPEFSSVQSSFKGGLDPFSYVNDQGQRVMRPPGLFDLPGAVCGAGMLAAVLGVSFFFLLERAWQRGAVLVLGFLGVAAIYLSQVRAALLITSGMIIVYVSVLGLLQKRGRRAMEILAVGATIVVAMFFFTVSFGGKAVSTRFATLTADAPVAVYYKSQRGSMVEEAFTKLLPDYPLGAGLGRWGMMRNYFGDQFNPDSPMIWAEVQWPAWILDGGIILLLLYVAAAVATVRHEVAIAQSKKAQLASLAAIVLACNAGVLAWTFSFTPFTTQLGLQFWFLAGALHGVADRYKNSKDEFGRAG